MVDRFRTEPGERMTIKERLVRGVEAAHLHVLCSFFPRRELEMPPPTRKMRIYLVINYSADIDGFAESLPVPSRTSARFGHPSGSLLPILSQIPVLLENIQIALFASDPMAIAFGLKLIVDVIEVRQLRIEEISNNIIEWRTYPCSVQKH